MLEFRIKGSDYVKGEVKKIGRAKAIAIVKGLNWEEGEGVIVIRGGIIEKMELMEEKKEKEGIIER